MADRARGRGSRDGIDRAILEARLGSTGTVLETERPKTRNYRPDVRNVASGAGTIESRSPWTQEGFSWCRTPGEAASSKRVESKFCTRCRTASLAHSDSQEVPTDAQPGTAREPLGGSAGRSPH